MNGGLGLKAPPAARMAKTKAQLNALADPISAGQPEALPWFLYHRKVYTDNTTTTLQFFDAIETNKGIGNMQAASALPSPQYYEVLAFGLDALRAPTAGGAAANVGAIDDVQRLLHTSECFWTFTYADKNFGPFAGSLLHPSGGVQGFGYGTTTADTFTPQYAHNGYPDGGHPVNGAIVLKPKVQFTLTITWPAPVNITADMNLRAWMWGILHRKVL